MLVPTSDAVSRAPSRRGRPLLLDPTPVAVADARSVGAVPGPWPGVAAPPPPRPNALPLPDSAPPRAGTHPRSPRLRTGHNAPSGRPERVSPGYTGPGNACVPVPSAAADT